MGFLSGILPLSVSFEVGSFENDVVKFENVSLILVLILVKGELIMVEVFVLDPVLVLDPVFADVLDPALDFVGAFLNGFFANARAAINPPPKILKPSLPVLNIRGITRARAPITSKKGANDNKAENNEPRAEIKLDSVLTDDLEVLFEFFPKIFNCFIEFDRNFLVFFCKFSRVSGLKIASAIKPAEKRMRIICLSDCTINFTSSGK